MISNSDFEKLWDLYKTEGEPQGVSINAFCISRGVNYNEFFDERSGKAERNKWFRKMHKSVVTLEVEGAPSSESKVTIEPLEDDTHIRKGGIQVFIRTNDGLEMIAKGEDYATFISTCQQKCRSFRDFFVDYVRAWNQGRRDFDRSSSARLLPKGRKNLIQLAFAPGA